MLDQWLQSADRHVDAFEYFRVVDVTELDEPTAEVKDHICKLLRESAVNLEFLEDMTRRLGWEKAEAMVHQRLPTNATARRGRFGEVVGVVMLSQSYGYVIPIEKAHFSITGGQSQPSTDAVLIQVDNGVVTEVCFVESKLRTRRDNAAGVEGALQLQADYAKEIPDMLSFTAARLFERRDPVYYAFMEYMASREDKRDTDSFRLLLFYERPIWSEQCLTNLDEASPAVVPLTVHTTRVNELASLVKELFERVGVIVVDDEP